MHVFAEGLHQLQHQAVLHQPFIVGIFVSESSLPARRLVLIILLALCRLFRHHFEEAGDWGNGELQTNRTSQHGNYSMKQLHATTEVKTTTNIEIEMPVNRVFKRSKCRLSQQRRRMLVGRSCILKKRRDTVDTCVGKPVGCGSLGASIAR